MTKDNEPTIAQLMDWLEERLPAVEATAMAARVKANPSLQEKVDWLRDFLQISQNTILVQPPDEVHQTAVATFTPLAKSKRPFAQLQTFLATLVTDSWQRPALANVRNVNLRHEPRQLIFSSDQADIALNAHIQPGSQQIDLDGQLFPLDDADPADFLVQLLQDGLEQRLSTVDSLGKFSLNGLTAGTYTLLLSSDQAIIEVAPITLQL